jgi:hypothetical protein
MAYVASKPPQIADAEILALMNAGNLVVRIVKPGTIEIWKWHGRRKRFERIVVKTYDEDGRLRVNVRLAARNSVDHRQRTIYLNRLVWLWTRREVVPNGFVIDHADEVCTNDWPDNLQLMTVEESDRQGRRLAGIADDDESSVPF